MRSALVSLNPSKSFCLYRVLLVAFVLITVTATAQLGRTFDVAGSAPHDVDGFAARSSVTVTIETFDRHPISDARILITDMSSGRSVATQYTGPSGQFEVPDLPRGFYEILAEKGIAQVREQFHADGTHTGITLRLNQTADNAFHSGQQIVSVQQMRVPEKAQRALQKAREWSAKGRLEEARHDIAKALEIAPNFSDALALRGIVNAGSRDFEAAESDLHKAIQLDNNNALAYVAMGAVYNMTNRFDEAMRELNRGISLDHTSWQAHFELSKAQLSKRMFSECLKELERANTLLGRSYSPLRLVRAQALYGSGSYADAVTEFQKYLDENRQSPVINQVKKALEEAQAASANHVNRGSGAALY